MVRVSIVVVTWNSKKHIEECLASLEGATRDLLAEIIVVDNASSDGTAALSANYTDLQQQEDSSNRSFLVWLGFCFAGTLRSRQEVRIQRQASFCLFRR